MAKRELKVIIDGTVKGLKQALDTADREISGFERGVNRVGEAMQRLGKYAGIAAVAGFTAMGTGVAKLGKEMLSGAGEVERYRAILETVTGSAETAGKKLDWLREFAKKTPFELPGLMEAATKLEAYGFSAEKYMQVLGDTAAALGKNVNDAVEALADATMGEFERLKEFGIKAVTEGSQIAFNYVDKSGKQQRVYVDKNNQEMIASTLTAIWNERYAGAMEKMSTTWEGMVSNLKDAWTSNLADIGADIMPTLKPFLDQLIDFVGGGAFRGALESIGSSFIGMAQAAMNAFEPFMGMLAEVAEKFGPVLEQVAGRLGTILADLFTRLDQSGIIDDLAQIASILADGVLDVVEQMLPTVVELLDAFLDIVTPVLEWANKLGIVNGIFQAWIAWKIVDVVRGLAGGLGSAAQNAGNLAASAGAATGNLQEAAGTASSFDSAAAGILGVAGAIAYTSEQVNNLVNAVKAANDAEGEWHETQRKRAEDMANIYGVTTKESLKSLEAELKNLGYAGESAVDIMENAFNDMVESAIQAGNQAAMIPDKIIQAFTSANPELARIGGEGMRLYLTRLLETNKSLSPESVNQIVRDLLAQFKSNDPAVRQKAAETMTGYLDQLVASGQLNKAQRTLIINTLIGGLDLSDNLYQLGTRVGRSYINGLLAAIPGAYIGPGGVPTVRSPGGRGNIPIMHSGGLVGGWVRAHTGLFASDEVPAILQKHEYVIRREAVEKYGVSTLDAINKGQMPTGTIYQISGNTFILRDVRNPRDFLPELSRLIANEAKMYRAVYGT